MLLYLLYMRHHFIRCSLNAAPLHLCTVSTLHRFLSASAVNGLASVGMSTKAGKRSVGFMGIGFKACHKRFAHVICSDRSWSFAFQEAALSAEAAEADGPPLPPSGWVLLPRWAPRAHRPSRGCTFELLAPRGGMGALQRDVRWLPLTVPPLLARTALAGLAPGSSPPIWELQWVDEVLRCSLHAPDSSADARGGQDARLGGVHASMCAVTVSRSSKNEGGRRGEQRWQVG